MIQGWLLAAFLLGIFAGICLTVTWAYSRSSN